MTINKTAILERYKTQLQEAGSKILHLENELQASLGTCGNIEAERNTAERSLYEANEKISALRNALRVSEQLRSEALDGRVKLSWNEMDSRQRDEAVGKLVDALRRL